jgi:hypothetical protein
MQTKIIPTNKLGMYTLGFDVLNQIISGKAANGKNFPNILENMVIMKAEIDYLRNGIVYTAFNPKFDEIDADEANIPEYIAELKVNSGGHTEYKWVNITKMMAAANEPEIAVN